MAITFNCPHCQFLYRLKDELAGKRASCKNPDCRQVIVIPQPATVPPSHNGPTIAGLGGIAPPAKGKDQTPLPKAPPPADIESAAQAALSDAPVVDEGPQSIAVTCNYCDHKWEEPIAKAGKNVLCPNEECRQRVKVPEPKKTTAENWRETGNRPTLAKENFEKPKDVVDAEAKIVSGEAWRQGGGAEQELEPIPLSRRLFFGMLVATPIFLVGCGVLYWWTNRVEVKQDRLMVDALAEYSKSVSEKEVSPAEAPLGSAVLEMMAGEYALRQPPTKETAATAIKHFTTVLAQLREAAKKEDKKAPSTVHFAIAAELAVAVVGLGGTEDQAREGYRIRWVPAASKPAFGLHKLPPTVHDELQHAYDFLKPADFDLKIAVARRLTRALMKHDQPQLVGELPVLLFKEAEQTEAKAIVALEMYRTSKAAEQVKAVGNDLKSQLDKGATGVKRDPFPSSAQTLWLIIPTDKAPTLIQPPPQAAGAPVSDFSRLAYTGLLLLQNKPDEALALARRPGPLPAQLRSLTLCAEWTADPTQALTEAQVAIAQLKGKKDVPLPPPFVVFRLVQLAAAAGKVDLAKGFADTLTEEGLRAWAKGDIVRLMATPENKSPIDEALAELPEDTRKLRIGNGWGRAWIARHNARLSGDRPKETKVVDKWPQGTVRPFGMAGIALGLKD